jgi:uncharacterized membrane protein SirB2
MEGILVFSLVAVLIATGVFLLLEFVFVNAFTDSENSMMPDIFEIIDFLTLGYAGMPRSESQAEKRLSVSITVGCLCALLITFLFY